MKEVFNSIWNRIKRYARETFYFISSAIFIKNFAAMLLTFGFLMFFVFWWLQCYTNHGESLQVHNYIGMPLQDAVRKAESRSFSIVISDSIFVVGKPPLEVLEQNPKPLSRVKENRKIYLTITKASPDLVNLPDITGGNDDFTQYSRKLRRLGVNAKIVDRKFSNKLEPNTILEVRYNEEEITDQLIEGFKVPMGTTLNFVVTERGGGTVPIPNVVCKQYDAASFLIGNFNLNIGSIIPDATVTDRETAFVWRQVPRYRAGVNIRIGEQVDLYITQHRPDGCEEESSIERGYDSEEQGL
ncbi:MAG: PASTA domain-containing protein [Bacteroidota bacterium]